LAWWVPEGAGALLTWKFIDVFASMSTPRLTLIGVNVDPMLQSVGVSAE